MSIGHRYPEQGGLWILTTGVISAEVDNFNGVKGKHVFQTETGLNRGNSGGPLLDGEGRMIGFNTAIPRVPSDGLPITSISFSLKSNVAAQWLREQRLGVRAGGGTPLLSEQMQPAIDQQTVLAVQPQGNVVQPYQSDLSSKPTTKQDIAQPVSGRPYYLDKLISDRAEAEADLDSMMSEMRGQMKGG